MSIDELTRIVRFGFQDCSSDRRLRDLVTLLNCLIRKKHHRESRLIAERIAAALFQRGKNGLKPYFTLEDGSSCRLAGDPTRLFFTPSGLKQMRDVYSSHRQLNKVDMRRFPASPIAPPEFFCDPDRIGEKICPVLKGTLFNFFASPSYDVIEEVAKEVFPC